MGARRRSTGGFRAIGRRCATARPPSRCTCCGGSCLAGTQRPDASPPRPRLFVALDLPEPARAALVDWQARALAGRSDLRVVAPDALHVTLAFLGHRPEAEIGPIAAT